jgi:hypothetical protein
MRSTRSKPRPSFKGNGDRNICKLSQNKITCDNTTKMADWRLAPRRFLFRLYSLRAGFSVCSSFEISFGSNFSFFSCLASLCPANRSTGARVEIGLIKAAKFCSISWTLRPAVNYPDRGTTCTASISASPVIGKHGMYARNLHGPGSDLAGKSGGRANLSNDASGSCT